MNDISLALKYLTRKKKRTCFIFLTFIIVNTLIFSIISIRDGADSALSDLIPEIQDYFYLESKFNPEPDTSVSEGSSISFSFSSLPITQEVINKISQISNVKQYACQYAELGADVTNEKNIPLNLVSYHNPPTEDDFSRILGVTDSETFCGSEMKLTEGRHITPGSSHAALVSAEYAELNGLKTGDSIILNNISAGSDTASKESSIKVTISGLYETFDERSDTSLEPFDLYANMIYVDSDTATSLDAESQGTTTVKFFVHSAEQLDAAVTQVKNLDIDWQKYDLINDADVPLTDRNSIEDISSLFTLLTWVTVIIGLLILTLIIILQTRLRTTEIGIQLTLGYSKKRIIFQHCIESIIPSLLSLVISYLITRLILKYSIFANDLYTPVLKPIAVLELSGINLLLIISSIFLSSIRLLRMKPRDIFSSID